MFVDARYTNNNEGFDMCSSSVPIGDDEQRTSSTTIEIGNELQRATNISRPDQKASSGNHHEQTTRTDAR